MDVPRQRGRAILAVGLAPLALTFVCVPAAHAQFGGPSFPVMSQASGNWTNPNTWITGSGPGVPVSSDIVTIRSTHDVELTADVTVENLTLNADSALDLNGHDLTVTGLLTLTGSAGSAVDLLSTGAAADVDVACLDAEHTNFSNVAVNVVDAQSCTQTTILRSGSSWTTSSFTQTGGNATIGTSLAGLSPTFNGASLRILGQNTIGGTLTLTGTGPIAFLPSSANTTPMLTLGGLSVTGTHAVSVDWTGVDPLANGTAATLVQTPGAVSLSGLTSTDTARTTFTRPTAGGVNQLVASYVMLPPPVNTGVAPSVSVATTANAGYAFPDDVFTCDHGGWSGATSFTYAWKSGSTTLPGTAATYTARAEDVGTPVTCHVTAVNTDASASGAVPTAINVAAKVVKTGDLVITSPSPKTAGLAKPGDVLSCGPATWTGAASRAYAWTRDASPISGQTAVTYTVVGDDLGKSVGCSETASSAATSATASATTPFGVPVAPVATFSAPAATTDLRTPAIGYTLSAGATVTGCKLDGTTLADCASGSALPTQVNGSHTFSLIVENAAGLAATFDRAFEVQAKPVLTIPAPPATSTGGPQTVTIGGVDVTSVSCTLAGVPVECKVGENTFVLPQQNGTYTLIVTATTPYGVTVVEHQFNVVIADGKPEYVQNKPPTPEPNHNAVTAPIVEEPAMLAPSGGELTRVVSGITAGSFDGGGIAELRGTDRVVVRPKTAGRFTVTWKTGDAVHRMPVNAFDPKQVDTANQIMGGVTSSTAALTCPLLTSRAPDVTWQTDEPENVQQGGPRDFKADLLPDDGLVTCHVGDDDDAGASKAQALIVGGKRFAMAKRSRTLTVAASGKATVQLKMITRGKEALAARAAYGKKEKKGKLAFDSNGALTVKFTKAGTKKIVLRSVADGAKFTLRVQSKKTEGDKPKPSQPLTIG